MAAPTGEAFTVDDLERMPDDGRRDELLDGVLVDPDPGSPSLEALDLVDGRCVPVGKAGGTEEWTAQLQFPVTVCPTELVTGLQQRR